MQHQQCNFWTQVMNTFMQSTEGVRTADDGHMPAAHKYGSAWCRARPLLRDSQQCKCSCTTVPHLLAQQLVLRAVLWMARVLMNAEAHPPRLAGAQHKCTLRVHLISGAATKTVHANTCTQSCPAHLQPLCAGSMTQQASCSPPSQAFTPSCCAAAQR